MSFGWTGGRADCLPGSVGQLAGSDSFRLVRLDWISINAGRIYLTRTRALAIAEKMAIFTAFMAISRQLFICNTIGK